MRHICLASFMALAGLTAMGGDMSNSIEYDHLYIIGDATPTSWDLGSAPELNRIDNGVFEWTGKLNAGEFKFMNTREAWHKHVVATENGITVDKGSTYTLNFFADWALSGDRDLKFRIPSPGDYTITVDLTCMRMKVAQPTESVQWPDSFYLTGSAVNDEVIDLSNDFGPEYKTTFSCRPGFIHLTDSKTETDQSVWYSPRYAYVDLTFGDGYYSPLFSSADKADSGWTVSVAGDYSIYLDKSAKTYLIRAYRQRPVLYLVGGCCEKSWNYWDDSNCRFNPDPENPDVMVWEGELRIGWDTKTNSDGSVTLPDEPDKFKILTAQDWFRETYHPYEADAPALGESNARISGGDDLKWTISKDGFYRLELNTRTEVLKGTYLGESRPAYSKPDGSAGIETIESASIQESGRFYNLQGIEVENPVNGIYIKVVNGKSSKIFVR